MYVLSAFGITVGVYSFGMLLICGRTEYLRKLQSTILMFIQSEHFEAMYLLMASSQIKNIFMRLLGFEC